jgi:hypothetical protein
VQIGIEEPQPETLVIDRELGESVGRCVEDGFGLGAARLAQLGAAGAADHVVDSIFTQVFHIVIMTRQIHVHVVLLEHRGQDLA